ncbi:MAG: hypothetical protein HQM09_06580 [Candidatus Riflebacteria bacterium]|nr:hypothetical protein [Candidatus Riflebacteria bacterium]
MEKIILPGKPNFADVLSLAGGKGYNLLKLTQAGVNVPPFAILSSLCFQEFLESFRTEFDSLVSEIDCSSPASIARTAGNLRKTIQRQQLSPSIRLELLEQVRFMDSCARPADIAPSDCFVDNSLSVHGGHFAIRSSALGEDSKEFSYAGTLDTCLFCRTDAEICNAVLICWSSIFSDRAVSYRHMRNIRQDTVSMAVVVQKMIDGVASGVAFSVNPTTGYIDEMMISAVWGLGEGLVSGALDADSFVVLKTASYPIHSRQIVEKSDQICFDRAQGHGTVQKSIDATKAMQPCLTDEQITKVAALAHSIERLYGDVPQDIEWTIDAAGGLWILQARPITTIDQPRVSDREYVTLWDNSNIIESYSGITTPLTFSFIKDAYHSVYCQFCQVLGVTGDKIQKNDFAFANMLGFLNGRVYYNLKNWYRLVSLLPGYSYNSRFMEGMMGVKVRFDLEVDDSENVTFFRKYFVELPRAAYVGLNLAWQFHTIDDRVKRFMNIYTNMYKKYEHFDFSNAPAHKCVEIYTELVTTVLGNWKAPIINDFMAMIFYGILKAVIKSWNLDRDGPLANDLMAGQGNIESTLPMRSLQKIARKIQTSSSLMDIFKKNDAGTLKEMFVRPPREGDLPELADMCRLVAQYLEEFGFRAMNELKLEEPSLSERPDFIFSMLKNYALGRLPLEEDTFEKERLVREKAERKAEEMLRGQKLFGLLPKTKVFAFVCDYARKAVRFREYQRFARAKMYGLTRRLFRGIGARFVERKLLKDIDDIFYLVKDEIISYVVGSACSQKLGELAALRKAEFAEYAEMDDLPDRVETRGVVYTNDLTRDALKVVAPDDPDLLQGIGGSSGVVRGKVKVILHPGDDMSLNGEILVASRTDPGWVPLFATASALIIERGSMLSHSVIVARELGLPAVIGVTGATRRLKTGDTVELNGSTGLIRILSRASEPS